jgi:hypothetical protein
VPDLYKPDHMPFANVVLNLHFDRREVRRWRRPMRHADVQHVHVPQVVQGTSPRTGTFSVQRARCGRGGASLCTWFACVRMVRRAPVTLATHRWSVAPLLAVRWRLMRSLARGRAPVCTQNARMCSYMAVAVARQWARPQREDDRAVERKVPAGHGDQGEAVEGGSEGQLELEFRELGEVRRSGRRGHPREELLSHIQVERPELGAAASHR